MALRDVIFRLLAAQDSLEELTDLLHRAYAPLGAMGLNYTAVNQSPEVTRGRIEGHECHVGIFADRIVATAVLHLHDRHLPACARREGMAYLSQFAVAPVAQGRGLGSRLLLHIEERAMALGYAEVGLDTALPATHLIDFYSRRGYEMIGETRFEGKTYTSVVMAKRLVAEGLGVDGRGSGGRAVPSPFAR